MRRLTVDTLGDAIVGYRAGDIAVVWTPYKFLFNGKVDHCGTDVITLMKVHDRWMITGLSDNARENCK